MAMSRFEGPGSRFEPGCEGRGGNNSDVRADSEGVPRLIGHRIGLGFSPGILGTPWKAGVLTPAIYVRDSDQADRRGDQKIVCGCVDSR